MADEPQVIEGEPVTALVLTPEPPVTESKWFRWRKDGTALITYLLDCEVHTFAFSVAANAILSFIPVFVLLYTLQIHFFHNSEPMKEVIDKMVNYFLPTFTKEDNWVAGSILKAAFKSSRGGVQLFSVFMVLVACTGIFLPLEVALNQAWGVVKSRNYIMNQIVALGLAAVLVVLAFCCVILNVGAQEILGWVTFQDAGNWFTKSVNGFFGGLEYAWMTITTGIASILFFFSIYWLLPNRKVPWRGVLKTSVITGVIWLVAKMIFAAILPHMHLDDLYGGFYVSVGLIFWAYTSGLILFAGAQFSVARLGLGGKQES